MEIESQVHPILKEVSEINQLWISDVRTCGGCGWYSRSPSLLSDDRIGYGDMTSRRYAYLRSSVGKDFNYHQLPLTRGAEVKHLALLSNKSQGVDK